MRRIVIISTDESGPPDNLKITYALWANVPTARQTFVSKLVGATSFFSQVPDVTTAELQALQAGQVWETVATSEWQPGTPLGQARTILQAALADWQSYVNSYNPWAHTGTFFDDSTNTWTIKTVA